MSSNVQTLPLFAPRITLRDVARHVGVSHTTIALALRNHPRISPQRRLEVQNAARTLGYRPDPELASLARYRWAREASRSTRGTIAWVAPEQAETTRHLGYEIEACRAGAQAVAERFGFALDPTPWASGMKPRQLQQALGERGIRGVLMIPPADQAGWADFDWNQFSAVGVGSAIPDFPCHVVAPNHFQAAILGREQMIQRGYRRIGFVIDREWDTYSEGRGAAGCFAAMSHDSFDPPALVTDRKAGSSAFPDWFRNHRPEAILTSDPGILEDLARLGLSVPEHVAVAFLATSDSSPVAGINPRAVEIGSIAAETLLGMLNRNERGIPGTALRIQVPGQWQDGSSLPDIFGRPQTPADESHRALAPA